MMRALVCLLFLWAGAALAETPDGTNRPEVRGAATAEVVMRPKARPMERPALAHGAQTRARMRAEIGVFAFSPTAPASSLRPSRRTPAIEAAATELRMARQRGQICGDEAIQGEALGPIAGAGGCGIDDAVRVRSVGGISLTPHATMDCRTASALKQWVAKGVVPAVGDEGGGVAALRIVGHYACRNRNNQSGGRLSEHATGRAVDIAGIQLRNGREMTVLTDWNSNRDGTQMRAMWRAACGPFGTVLGPESDRHHRDHFHLDTARYRSGSYCR